jgi:hypothetical protein
MIYTTSNHTLASSWARACHAQCSTFFHAAAAAEQRSVARRLETQIAYPLTILTLEASQSTRMTTPAMPKRTARRPWLRQGAGLGCYLRATVYGICSVFQGRAPGGQRVQASLLRTYSKHWQADSDPPEIGVQSHALIHQHGNGHSRKLSATSTCAAEGHSRIHDRVRSRILPVAAGRAGNASAGSNNHGPQSAWHCSR